jgi:ubiquinone/menaquinone biosynthesis C-methylase UbiE
MQQRDAPNESQFDGLAGRLSAPVMAWMNRDMEEAAAEALGLEPSWTALSIGCGPGEGVASLARRLDTGRVVGIDPSSAMLQAAARRNRAATGRGQVVLQSATADRVPWPEASFDGVTATNCLQLWSPLRASVAELARVLRPGGIFVAMTHVWAVERRMPPDDWLVAVCRALTEHGFRTPRTGRRRFRSGSALVLRTEAGLRRVDDGAAPSSVTWAGGPEEREERP